MTPSPDCAGYSGFAGGDASHDHSSSALGSHAAANSKPKSRFPPEPDYLDALRALSRSIDDRNRQKSQLPPARGFAESSRLRRASSAAAAPSSGDASLLILQGLSQAKQQQSLARTRSFGGCNSAVAGSNSRPEQSPLLMLHQLLHPPGSDVQQQQRRRRHSDGAHLTASRSTTLATAPLSYAAQLEVLVGGPLATAHVAVVQQQQQQQHEQEQQQQEEQRRQQQQRQQQRRRQRRRRCLLAALVIAAIGGSALGAYQQHFDSEFRLHSVLPGWSSERAAAWRSAIASAGSSGTALQLRAALAEAADRSSAYCAPLLQQGAAHSSAAVAAAAQGVQRAAAGLASSASSSAARAAAALMQQLPGRVPLVHNDALVDSAAEVEAVAAAAGSVDPTVAANAAAVNSDATAAVVDDSAAAVKSGAAAEAKAAAEVADSAAAAAVDSGTAVGEQAEPTAAAAPATPEVSVTQQQLQQRQDEQQQQLQEQAQQQQQQQLQQQQQQEQGTLSSVSDAADAVSSVHSEHVVPSAVETAVPDANDAEQLVIELPAAEEAQSVAEPVVSQGAIPAAAVVAQTESSAVPTDSVLDRASFVDSVQPSEVKIAAATATSAQPEQQQQQQIAEVVSSAAPTAVKAADVPAELTGSSSGSSGAQQMHKSKAAAADSRGNPWIPTPKPPAAGATTTGSSSTSSVAAAAKATAAAAARKSAAGTSATDLSSQHHHQKQQQSQQQHQQQLPLDDMPLQELAGLLLFDWAKGSVARALQHVTGGARHSEEAPSDSLNSCSSSSSSSSSGASSSGADGKQQRRERSVKRLWRSAGAWAQAAAHRLRDELAEAGID
jgi:hypothetical protein